MAEGGDEDGVDLSRATDPREQETDLAQDGGSVKRRPDRENLRAAGLKPFAEDARTWIVGIVGTEERDPHRASSLISASQRRAYFANTEKAASQQSTSPRRPSRKPPSRAYMRAKRSQGRKRRRPADARTPRRRRSSADQRA